LQIFSLTPIQGETSSHIDSPAPKSQREVDSFERRDDWCYGRLTPDEKRKIQEEIATIYSKHQGNKEELQKSLEKVIQNHTGTESDKRSAEVAAMTVDSFRKLNEVSQFSDALSALSKGEKIKDSALSKTAEALKGDFEKLKSLGFKFDPEKQKWDLSEVKDDVSTSGDNNELKQAMANLISPEFAEKVGQRDREVKDALKRFGEEKKSFLRASKESNSYANAMTGRLGEMLGYERGVGGKTAPEIEREGAYKGMLAHLKRMKDTLGVEPEAVDDIISSIQDAVSKDSAGLAALDQDLTQKIGALKTTAAVLGVGAVAVTGGLAGPTFLGGVLAGAGTTVTSGAAGVAGGIALGFQAIPAAINIAIETASGKSLSCAAMDELYKRGANAVASTAIAAGTVAGFGAAGSVLSQNSLATAGLGAGVAFTGLGAAGAIQNGKDLLHQWKLASEAEARGDKETAAEIRREVLKRGIELGLDVAWLGYGLNGVVRGYKGLKASKEATDLRPEPKSTYMDQKELLRKHEELSQKAISSARGQSNNGFAAEAEQTRAMADYRGNTYKVRVVDGPQKKFPNGQEGQVDAELTIFPIADKRVDVIVDSKGRGLDVAQIQKYQSTESKSVFVVRDDKALNHVGVLAKIKEAFNGNIAQARGQVFVMSREQYLNFLKTGEITPSFNAFLSAGSAQEIPLTNLSLAQESRLFGTLSRIPNR